jgi:hypothetical protein
MRTDRINEWIVKYNEGSLDGCDLEEFIRLLAEDPELRKELRLDKEIDLMLQERDLLEFRKAILKARQGNSPGNRRWFLLAATLAVLLTGGGFVLYRALFLAKSEHPQISSQITSEEKGKPGIVKTGPGVSTDSVPEPKNPLLAERFFPLNSLENLVGESTRADDILLLEPESALKIHSGDTVTFAWKTESSDPVEICLFDNTGRKVLTVRPTGKLNYLMKTGKLKPGLYYWKLLKNDQLVTAGKIRME